MLVGGFFVHHRTDVHFVKYFGLLGFAALLLPYLDDKPCVLVADTGLLRGLLHADVLLKYEVEEKFSLLITDDIIFFLGLLLRPLLLYGALGAHFQTVLLGLHCLAALVDHLGFRELDQGAQILCCRGHWGRNWEHVGRVDRDQPLLVNNILPLDEDSLGLWSDQANVLVHLAQVAIGDVARLSSV